MKNLVFDNRVILDEDAALTKAITKAYLAEQWQKEMRLRAFIAKRMAQVINAIDGALTILKNMERDELTTAMAKGKKAFNGQVPDPCSQEIMDAGVWGPEQLPVEVKVMEIGASNDNGTYSGD